MSSKALSLQTYLISCFIELVADLINLAVL